MSAARALPFACLLLAGAGLCIAASLQAGLLWALVAGALLNGIGTGTAAGVGLAAIGVGCPPDQRGEATSTFFAILYLMLAVPVIGVGLLARVSDIQVAGLTFGLAVAVLAVLVLASLLRSGRPARLAR